MPEVSYRHLFANNHKVGGYQHLLKESIPRAKPKSSKAEPLELTWKLPYECLRKKEHPMLVNFKTCQQCSETKERHESCK
jgi:hypothetical protein